MESIEPKSGSAETTDVKGKMMDQKREGNESKKSNQHPRTENKSKNERRNKPTQELEESARTISSSDRKMKEGACSLKGICFSSNYSVSDVSEVFTPKFQLFSFILATLSFRTAINLSECEITVVCLILFSITFFTLTSEKSEWYTVVKCRILLKLRLEIFGRIKIFACRYPLYFWRENVEVARIDVIFTGLLVASLVLNFLPFSHPCLKNEHQ